MNFDPWRVGLFLFVGGPLVLLFFAPTLFAIGQRNFWMVLLANILIGWTGLGWSLAMAMAFKHRANNYRWR